MTEADSNETFYCCLSCPVMVPPFDGGCPALQVCTILLEQRFCRRLGKSSFAAVCPLNCSPVPPISHPKCWLHEQVGTSHLRRNNAKDVNQRPDAPEREHV